MKKLSIIALLLASLMLLSSCTHITSEDANDYSGIIEKFRDHKEWDTNLFPTENEDAQVNGFYCNVEENDLFGPSCQIYYDCTYSEEDYLAQVDRISHLPGVGLNEDKFRYPAYVVEFEAMVPHYEYALLLEEEHRIAYVLIYCYNSLIHVPDELMPAGSVYDGELRATVNSDRFIYLGSKPWRGNTYAAGETAVAVTEYGEKQEGRLLMGGEVFLVDEYGSIYVKEGSLPVYTDADSIDHIEISYDSDGISPLRIYPDDASFGEIHGFIKDYREDCEIYCDYVSLYAHINIYFKKFPARLALGKIYTSDGEYVVELTPPGRNYGEGYMPVDWDFLK